VGNAYLGVLLFSSGAAALVLEVCWFRRTAQVAGATSIAMAGVFAAVIGGMAAGSYWLGKRADAVRRPLRLYAGLEAGVAFLGLASPWLLDFAQPLFDQITALDTAPGVRAGLRFFLAAVLLAPPAILMGGTLPVMACAMRARRDQRGRSIGILYAANTLGGVAGTVAAGFYLIPTLGLALATRAGALLSVVAAIGAFLARARTRETTSSAIERGPDVGRTRRAIRLYACSGFLGLAAEVAFTRQLVLVFGSTTYAFTTMLAVFLLGIGLGGAIGARWAKRREGHLARLESVVAATAALLAIGALAVYALPRLYLEGFLLWRHHFGVGIAMRFALSALVLLPGAIGLGAAFPLAVHVTTVGEIGAGTGRLYAANTFASIAGSTVAVFWLVPLLGPHLAVALIAVPVALYAAMRQRRRAALVFTVAAAAACLPPPATARERLHAGVYFMPGMFLADDEVFDPFWDLGADIAFTKYGRDATVTVWRWHGTSNLLIDGKAVATDQVLSDDHHLALLGHAPMLLHPNPQRVLIVGLGMGTTYRAVRLHAPAVLRVVELERAVVDASAFLGTEPDDIVINDARSYLRATDERFDVITSDPIHPWVRGGGDLYTEEYFETCRERLASDGIACQWLPIYQMGVDDIAAVLRTFCAVFHQADVYFGGGDMVLVGKSGGPFLEPREPGKGPIRDALRALGTPRLGRLRVAGRARMQQAAGAGPLLTDDALRLEFSTPRRIGNDKLGEALAWSLELWERRRPPFSLLLRADVAAIDEDWDEWNRLVGILRVSHLRNPLVRRYLGEEALFDADLTARRGDVDTARASLARARPLLGDDDRLVGVEAWIEITAGRRDEARKLVQKLRRRHPNSAYLARWAESLE